MLNATVTTDSANEVQVAISYERIHDGRRPLGVETRTVEEFIMLVNDVHRERDTYASDMLEMSEGFLDTLLLNQRLASFVAEYASDLRRFCEKVLELNDLCDDNDGGNFYDALRELAVESDVKVPSWGLWSDVPADGIVKEHVFDVQYRVGQLVYLSKLSQQIDGLLAELISGGRRVKYIAITPSCSEATVFYID